ncbi:MAG: alcohol dehydrogenase catalytic domain-containing protein, partial [Helicobacter sp.]|nr:alcohol dehydrogenase catalytic domain-containing protein [Helicobacter sp.]
MQDSQRREFIKDSAKVVGGLAALTLGADTLFAAQNEANSAKIVFKEGERIPAKGYAAFSKDWKFKPYSFTRHPLGENDVLIAIRYAGICHSDLHTVKGDHGKANYPMVPGHEIAGEVVAVGKKVSK